MLGKHVSCPSKNNVQGSLVAVKKIEKHSLNLNRALLLELKKVFWHILICLKGNRVNLVMGRAGKSRVRAAGLSGSGPARTHH